MVLGEDPERSALLEDFKGRHWKDVPHDAVRWHHDELPYFTEEGRRFFLPAFMLACMEPDDIGRSAVLHLVHPDSYAEAARYSPEQREAIRAFLLAEGRAAPPHLVERALREAWGALPRNG